MPSTLYFCTQDNNTCPKKESCKRYINIENEVHATLFNTACTADNNYVLFIQAEKEVTNNGL
jgi:hypothetical protein